MKKWGIGLLAMVLCIGTSYAQSGLYYLDKQWEDEDPMDEVTHMRFGANMLSNNVYMGRKDSGRVPYLSPYIGYYNRNGFYVDGSVSYALTKRTGHFDVATIAAGYDHAFTPSFLAGVHAEKYFYYRYSPSISSVITESGGVYVLYKNDLIEPTLAFDVNNGTTQDFVISAVLDHHFQLADKKLHLYPALTFFVGSQHFYDNYFINRTLKKDNIAITGAVENPGKIRPLCSEFSIRTVLYTGNWMFTFMPTYATPLGAGTITLPNRIYTEKLKSTFFIELDACYRKPRS